VSAALEFIEALGAARYRAGLGELARAAASRIAAAWGVAPGAPPEMFAAMVTLPLPVAEAGSEEAAKRWRRKLLEEHRVEVPVFAIEGRLWVRLSAQVYNELADYEALARAFGRGV
ncbi:MAG: aminotransferase class V-fold PLP-dependent enzyme, partial [Rhodocyclales bacterium]|nr:aminotransferase class V-fold PLP-dependent enzyme [Rhodocyclales bacterium]